MGAIATAFTAAFVDASNVAKSAARALGATIESYVAAPRTHNANAAASPTSAPGGYVHRMIGADAANASSVLDAFGTYPIKALRRANGTGAAPTAIASLDILGTVDYSGWYVTGGPGYAVGAQMWARATQNWTSTARGSQLVFGVTPNGSATLAYPWIIDQDFSLKGLGPLGYSAGAGGTVTQSTSKSTGVTLNKICGEVTLNNASLANNTVVSFDLTNSLIEAADNVILNHVSGGTLGVYRLNGRCAAGKVTIDVIQYSGGALAEAIVIRFTVFKAANS